VCYNVLQWEESRLIAAHFIAVFVAACVAVCAAVCCSVLQVVAGCGNVLQCVAVCCSVLQWQESGLIATEVTAVRGAACVAVRVAM